MKKMIQDHATGIGLSLFGVAPPDRFAGLPASVHPASILPEVRSILVVGKEIPRGDYRGVEEGTLWTFASKHLEQLLLLDMVRYIEQQSGYEAVPYMAHPAKTTPLSRPVSPDRPLPNVTLHLEYAAVAAGLGEISLIGQLLTPRFGSRNALGIILTELELEPDPLYSGSLCDHAACGKCAAICPAGAINPNKTVTLNIGGRLTELAEVNYHLCRMCPNGAAPDFINKAGQEELMLAFTGNQPDVVETSTVLTRRNVPNIANAVCSRTCLAYLEHAERRQHRYVEPFRDTKPWLLDTWER